MEDNNKDLEKGVQTPPVANTENQIPEPDYKSLYEKTLRDKEKESKYAQDLKSKYQAKLTEEEKQKAVLEERENYYKELEKKVKATEIKAELSKTISDPKILDEVSGLLVDGNVNTAISKINNFVLSQRETYEKQLKEAKLTTNPTPPAESGRGNAGEPTKKDFEKMSYEDRVSFKEKYPELYEKYTK